MGVVVWLVMEALLARFVLDSLGHDVIVVLGAFISGVAAYTLCALALRIPELLLVRDVVRSAFGSLLRSALFATLRRL
jgi:hypothetical protein